MPKFVPINPVKTVYGTVVLAVAMIDDEWAETNVYQTNPRPVKMGSTTYKPHSLCIYPSDHALKANNGHRHILIESDKWIEYSWDEPEMEGMKELVEECAGNEIRAD